METAQPQAQPPISMPPMPQTSGLPVQEMSLSQDSQEKSGPSVVFIILVCLILVGGGAAFAYFKFLGPMAENNKNPGLQTPSMIPIVLASPLPTPVPTPVSESGNSVLDQDLQSVDASLDKISSDSAKVDQGLTDQADPLQ